MKKEKKNKYKYFLILALISLFYFLFKKDIAKGINSISMNNNDHIDTLHPKIRDKVRAFLAKCESLGIPFDITSSHRTWDEQSALYAQGRTSGGKIVTNAIAGSSYHNYGLAFDFIPKVNGKRVYDLSAMDRIGRLAEKEGFNWGDEFNDKPHIEYKGFGNISKLSALYKSGKVIDKYVIV